MGRGGVGRGWVGRAVHMALCPVLQTGFARVGYLEANEVTIETAIERARQRHAER